MSPATTATPDTSAASDAAMIPLFAFFTTRSPETGTEEFSTELMDLFGDSDLSLDEGDIESEPQPKLDTDQISATLFGVYVPVYPQVPVQQAPIGIPEFGASLKQDAASGSELEQALAEDEELLLKPQTGEQASTRSPVEQDTSAGAEPAAADDFELEPETSQTPQKPAPAPAPVIADKAPQTFTTAPPPPTSNDRPAKAPLRPQNEPSPLAKPVVGTETAPVEAPAAKPAPQHLEIDGRNIPRLPVVTAPTSAARREIKPESPIRFEISSKQSTPADTTPIDAKQATPQVKPAGEKQTGDQGRGDKQNQPQMPKSKVDHSAPAPQKSPTQFEAVTTTETAHNVKPQAQTQSVKSAEPVAAAAPISGPAPTTAPSQPKVLDMQVKLQTANNESVEVRFRETRGTLDVSVKTADPEMRRAIEGRADELSQSLSDNGFEMKQMPESEKPFTAEFATTHINGTAEADARNTADTNQQQNQSGQQEQAEQQQQQQQQQRGRQGRDPESRWEQEWDAEAGESRKEEKRK